MSKILLLLIIDSTKPSRIELHYCNASAAGNESETENSEGYKYLVFVHSAYTYKVLPKMFPKPQNIIPHLLSV